MQASPTPVTDRLQITHDILIVVVAVGLDYIASAHNTLDIHAYRQAYIQTYSRTYIHTVSQTYIHTWGEL